MNRIESARIARMLSLAALVSLPACVIEGGGTYVEPAPGCASLSGNGTMGLVSLSSQRGYFYSMESFAFPGYYVRHANSRGMISTVFNRLERDDATWRIVPGLADSRCVSFESRNQPGEYLRHQNSEIFLSAYSGDGLFLQDATFCPRPGLADDRELSFETCNYPGKYLNQYEDLLYIDEGSGFEFDEDATFLLQDPWSP